MPISDRYSDFQVNPGSPIEGGFDISPNDASDVLEMTRALMVAGAGDLTVTLKNGDHITLAGVMPGVIYPFRVSRVWATGTTATNIKGLV